MSVSKASFNPENSGPFNVQFNPVNFKFNKPVTWGEAEEQGQESKLEFQKAKPASIEMELHFDGTSDGTNVHKAWVSKLLELTNPSMSDNGDNDKKRPPKVDFSWGEFSFTGVVESVNTTYTMFSQQGSPIRAKVSLKMKEWTPENNYSSSGSGRALNTDKVQLVTVQAGQTLSQIAAQNNTTQRDILNNNPQLDSFIELAAGTVLAIF
ncbi:MAG: LysM peptidoglycan-binding domain-containing protein [Myxococcota bacterium]